MRPIKHVTLIDRIRLSLPLVCWVGLLFAFSWLAYQPLTSQAQIILALSLLSFLLIIMWSMRWVDYASENINRFFVLTAAAIAVFISLRYFSWRINHTISLHDPFSFIGAMLLLLAEIYAMSVFLLGIFVNAWPVRRSPPPLPQDTSALPTVDIVIPSYNESADLLELTLIAATQVNYPRERLNVYLCDDGGTVQRRNAPATAEQALERHHALKVLCESFGAIYVTRERNENAKAGNINAALQDHCQGDLVLVLDADHIPTADILENTVGFFLRDSKLFLVQTAHHFINPDPLERNLRTYDRMPSENEMFYSIIHHGLDAWNASFFCGSAALLRRVHLDEIGGISGKTITEDAETAMMLHARGYNSAYFGKPMIAGLQPETFTSFILQRSRWAQGMMQIFLLKNPWQFQKMRLAQRLAYTSSIGFWFFPFARIIFYIAPALYLLFSLKIVDAFMPADLLGYALPHVIAALALSNIVYGRTRWPFISELYETIQSTFAISAIIRTIRSPRSPTFFVTPKSEELSRTFISSLALPFYVMLLFNIILIVAGIVRLQTVPEDTGIIWLTMTLTAVNLIYALAAIGIMLEESQKRSSYRLSMQAIKTSGWLYPEDGSPAIEVQLLDISHLGTRLISPQPVTQGEMASLKLHIPALNHQPARISCQIVRSRRTSGQWDLGLSFQLESIEDKRVIVALVYGDSDRHEANQQKRQRRIGLLTGFIYLIRIAFIHSRRNFSFLTRLSYQRITHAVRRVFMPTASRNNAE